MDKNQNQNNSSRTNDWNDDRFMKASPEEKANYGITVLENNQHTVRDPQKFKKIISEQIQKNKPQNRLAFIRDIYSNLDESLVEEGSYETTGSR
jgi:hypothetical protein